MSAARAGVSTVAISKEPTSAPAKVFIFMTTHPLCGTDAGTRRPPRLDCARFPMEAPELSRRCAGADAFSEAEHVEHRGGRRVLQLRCILHDERGLLGAHEHGDVLLAIDRIAYRRRVNPGSGAEAPDFLQR